MKKVRIISKVSGPALMMMADEDPFQELESKRRGKNLENEEHKFIFNIEQTVSSEINMTKVSKHIHESLKAHYQKW